MFGLRAPSHEVASRLPKLNLKAKNGCTLNETQNITYFYTALLNWQARIVKLKRKPMSRANIEAFRTSQRFVLNALHLIYQDMDDALKLPREYLNPYNLFGPYRTSFHEEVFFMAEAITLNIYNSPIYDGMRNQAVALFNSFDYVRKAIVARSTKNVMAPYDDLYPVLRHFDNAWVNFEILFLRFRAHFNQANASKIEDHGLFEVIGIN